MSGKSKKSKQSNNNDNQKTKKIETLDNKTKETKETKTKEGKKLKKNKKSSKHPKLKRVLQIFGILFLLLIIVAAGMVGGIAFGLFGDDLEISKENLSITASNSVVYDIEGNIITSLNGSDENREIIGLNDMGQYLPKAFVAIEDERFYEHQGVDIKRTLAATFNYIIHFGNSSYGGSTLTQQLIKNATSKKEKSATRKVEEIVKAFKVEKIMSKDEILESYLNIIPLGGGGKNIHGVEMASRYYFDKHANEVNIAEAAFIAGITHSPNIYNPFKENPSADKIRTRTKTVLSKMKELGKISEEEYNSAVQEVENGLNFKQGTVVYNNSLSYHTEEAIKQIVKQLAQEKGLDEEVARTRINSGGYAIYTTQNTAVQGRLEEEYKKDKYIGKGYKKDKEGNLLNAHTQSSMTIIDHTQGYVVAVVGGLGEKTAYGLNRAVSAPQQPGSSIKPIASIGPGLEMKTITVASVLDDTPKSWGSYNPHNAYSGYKGLLNIRKMIELSSNLPEVKLIQKITPTKSIEYLKKFGLSYIDDEKDNSLSLVLGGLSKGATSLEMAAAYSAINNNGEYIAPTFYTKVVSSSGSTILEAKQERTRVLSEQNAYLLKSILKEPVNGANGTATDCKISGMDVGAKTGTTDDKTDSWLCGFTPYYTAATWFGYDNREPIRLSGNQAKKIWIAVMKDIHKGLEEKKFEKPSGLVTANVCKDSGLLATDLCGQDPRGSRSYTEMFVKGTVPTERCTTHVKLKICKETGKIATDFCKELEEKVFITRPEGDNSWKSAADAQYMAPTETCNIHTQKADTTKPEITLKGKEVITLKLKQAYKEEGATAKDDVDGDITSKIKIEGKVDTNKIGKYTITYTVADVAGNTATKTRTVNVVDDSKNNAGGNTNNTTNTIGNTTNTTTNTINTNNTGNKKQ